MNILSFDVEEWYIEKMYLGDRPYKYQQYDYYLNSILDILDSKNIKATFMCVGKLAALFPNVVRNISERGHEIGCHSNDHIWLTSLSPRQLRVDTKEAVDTLQDVCGRKVRCYRAPAFSIGEKNKWAIEILAENGIEIDSSIFPAARDFGGFSSFVSAKPAIIQYNGIKIKEYPICTINLLGKNIAYSGGGYFRFFPLSFVRKNMLASDYAISYFHIGDVVKLFDFFVSKELYEQYFREKGTLINRIKRQVKSSIGIGAAFEKMCRLIQEIDFISIEESEKHIAWDDIDIVKIQP